MRCPTCGTELPPGESFCRECGKEVITAAGTVQEADPVSHLPQPRPSPAGPPAAPRSYPVSRITGVVIFLFGALLLASAIRFGVPNGKGFGIMGLVLGGAFFGLSFVPNPQPAPNAPEPLSTADTLTKIFYEPEPAFKNLKHHPRWLAAILVVGLVAGLYQLAVFQRLGPERMADDAANRVIEGGFLQGQPIAPDDFRQYMIGEAIKTATVDKIFAPIGAVAGWTLFVLALAGLHLLGVMAFGGKMNFWQSLSVTAYSAIPPAIILAILNLVLLFTQSVDDIIPLKAQSNNLARADLGLLFSPADRPVLYTLASFVGLFTIYRLWLTATGLKTVADKIKSGSAWAIVLILVLLGALLMSLLALFFPTFVA
ncbi:MAG TPA: zinc ribbon domain-containing protein [Pyrinomonadaceae bacterium]|nr:zinc ribbon domain-containing protein [Pyrinomonadaceae bacterium]